MGSVPAWLAMNNGGFGNGLGGWGGGILGFFLGLLFGNGWGGFGGGFGGFGGGNGAGFLSNQLNNDSGRELLMNAINSNGEASRAAISALASSLGQDFNLVNSAVQTLQSGLSSLALQQAVSVPQIINSIQSGNASLASQLCQCCCENRLAICEQTNAIQNSIAGVNQNIAANRAAQQLSDCQQTYALTDTMNRNYLALDNKIDALESSRKDREITSLTAKVAQLESQNFTTGVVGSAIAPVNAALNALAKEVDDIKCKMPNTVPVTWPNLAAVNTTPYVSGGYYQGGFNGYYGGGVPGFNGGFNF
ncbi:MAG: hypothetical protein J6O51_11270 [Bacteroidales bacterium]|nr:hypothetical protein [Bacteroidales bacterium]